MEIELNEHDDRQLRKLHASAVDIESARKYAQEILKKNWFRTPWSRGRGYFHQSAYVTAMVVSYARPFAHGRGKDQLPFPQKLITYSPEQRALHDRLLNERMKIYAHSDLEHWAIKPWKSGEFETTIVKQPTLRVPREDVELLLTMTDNLLANIITKYRKILEKYGTGNAIWYYP